jgi:hypothetical protein
VRTQVRSALVYLGEAVKAYLLEEYGMDALLTFYYRPNAEGLAAATGGVVGDVAGLQSAVTEFLRSRAPDDWEARFEHFQGDTYDPDADCLDMDGDSWNRVRCNEGSLPGGDRQPGPGRDRRPGQERVRPATARPGSPTKTYGVPPGATDLPASISITDFLGVDHDTSKYCSEDRTAGSLEDLFPEGPRQAEGPRPGRTD